MDHCSLILGRRGRGITTLGDHIKNIMESKQKQTPSKQEQRWAEAIGRSLIKSVTLEWTDTWFYCDKCGIKVRFNPKSESLENWHCTNIIDTDETGDEIRCDGTKLVHVKVPQFDTITSEQLEFWQAFQTRK